MWAKEHGCHQKNTVAITINAARGNGTQLMTKAGNLGVGRRTAAIFGGATGGTALAGTSPCRCKDMCVVGGGRAHYHMM
jgi:hypothetical protein